MLLYVAVTVMGVLLYRIWERLGAAETRINVLSTRLEQLDQPPMPVAEQEQPLEALPETPVEMVSVLQAPPAEPLLEPEPVPPEIMAPPPETIVLPAEEPVIPAAPPRGSAFEEILGSRLPIWAGGITLAIAGLFIVKYSIDIGLLSPAVRVSFGLLFAVLLVAGAELARRFSDRVRDERVAQALAGAGVAVSYASVLVATNVYALVFPTTGFIGLALTTAAALGLALRFGAPSAVLGLVGGLSAPALVGGPESSVSSLALYLMLTIGALAGVARRQGWTWLAAAALVGGFGWGAMLIATATFDVVTTSAVGAMLICLALVIPLLATGLSPKTEPDNLLRLLTVGAGSVQMALLIVQGGFGALQLGLYGLLSLAVIFLALIDKRAKAMPPIALSVGLATLAFWPDADPAMFRLVAASGLLLFGGSGLAAAWHADRGRTACAQAVAAALGIFAIGWLRHPALFTDHGWAVLALVFALAVGLVAALGWKRAERTEDFRFALLATAAASLIATAALFIISLWHLPPVLALLLAVFALIANRARDWRLDNVVRLAGVLVIASLFASLQVSDELLRAFGQHPGLAPLAGLWRWGVTALAIGFISWLERERYSAIFWQVVATLMASVALAQLLPEALLPIGYAAIAGALLWRGAVIRTFSMKPAVWTLAAVALGWTAATLAHWLVAVLPSLGGEPVMAADLPDAGKAVLRLLLPPALIAAGGYRQLDALSVRVRIWVATIAATVVLIGAHILFKHVLQIDSRADFVRLGFGERLVLDQLLFAAGALAWHYGKRVPGLSAAARALTAVALARVLWFDFLVLNPLFNRQMVGGLPVLNLLIPAYGLPLVWLWNAARHEPERTARFSRWITGFQMASILLLAALTVRQLFHGSILTGTLTSPGEDIARSLAAIALAIGFLRRGIVQGGRAWRIAALWLMLGAALKVFLFDASGLSGLLRIGSFVALGFSLIGIGWLYSRYLRGDTQPALTGR